MALAGAALAGLAFLAAGMQGYLGPGAVVTYEGKPAFNAHGTIIEATRAEINQANTSKLLFVTALGATAALVARIDHTAGRVHRGGRGVEHSTSWRDGFVTSRSVDVTA